MLVLALPWWEFIVRAVAVFGCLLLLVRLSGKRTIGQFTPFDLLVVVLLSESVSNALSGGDTSVTGGLISAATLIALNFGLAWATSHDERVARVVDGRAVLLGRNGRIYEQTLKRERISKADLQEALREHDCALKDMRCAFLESDGGISIMKR